jgi:hypothetical protein
MSPASERTIQVLMEILQVTALGTNVALLRIMWAMVTGSFLRSRGAVMTALHLCGFTPVETRRSWQALRYGIWNIGEMIGGWQVHVQRAEQWQASRYEGYKPVAADVTTFWRPRLQGWKGKFYQALAQRAMTGVGLGVVVEVGRVGRQRIPILRQLIRPQKDGNHDKGLQATTLRWVGQHLAADEVLLYDGGTHLAEVAEAGIGRYVIRLALNCVARCNVLPPRTGKQGRPAEYGVYVRPLARQRKDNTIAATPADSTTTFPFQARIITAEGWHGLVRSDQKVDERHQTFTIWVFTDPNYRQPLVVATNLAAAQAETIYRLYRDRWPVEEVPLVAKQMIGLHRHFVSAFACCYRLPELALLAANVLTYLAAVLPAIPTAFWDRHPKKHRAVSAVSWLKLTFPMLSSGMTNSEKKRPSLTTCPKELPPIGVENGFLNLFSAPLAHIVKVHPTKGLLWSLPLALFTQGVTGN